MFQQVLVMNAPFRPAAAPDVVDTATRLRMRLDTLVRAIDPVELDVAVLRLRSVLRDVEAVVQRVPRGDFARMLRRVAVLDELAGACLLADLPALERLARIRPCPPKAAGRWLQRLQACGALIALPQPWLVRRLAASAGSAAG